MGLSGSHTQPRHKEECAEHMVPISPGDFFSFSFFFFSDYYYFPPIFCSLAGKEGKRQEDPSGPVKAGSAGARLGFGRRGGREEGGEATRFVGVFLFLFLFNPFPWLESEAEVTAVHVPKLFPRRGGLAVPQNDAPALVSGTFWGAEPLRAGA